MNRDTRKGKMNLSKHGLRLLIYGVCVCLLAALVPTTSPANVTDFANFFTTYPTAVGLSCIVCHNDLAGVGKNNYADAYKAAAMVDLVCCPAGLQALKLIENLDSDGDGFTNIAEINALTFPGNASSFPGPADTLAPAVTLFALPATSSFLKV